MAPSRWLTLGLLTALLASTAWVSAQPPRKEEEEDPKGKTARPVVPVPVAEPGKADAPPPSGVDPDVGTMAEEAKKAKNAAARDLFRSLSLPYDRLNSTFAGAPPLRIELWPTRDLPEEEIDVRQLTPNLKESFPKKLATGSGFVLTPFEMIVLEQVETFLARDIGLSKDRQLEYGARAVAAGLRWHLEMVDKGKRVGKKWDEVKALLRTRLIGIQRERFRLFVEAKEYDKADELGLSLLSRYQDNQEITKDVYHLQLYRSNLSPKTTDADLLRLRESLLAYERLLGKKDEALTNSVRNRLRSRAKTLLDEAKADDARKMTAAALAKLRQAELFDPDLPGIAEARLRMRGKVLYVGVSKLPEMMSPATATTDAERWATELMFEGLLQAVPDPEVIRYRPQLAEGPPAVTPLARAFTLPRNVRWGRDGGEGMDARDVRATLYQLRQPGYRERWCSDGLDVFEEIDRIDDPFRLRLAYRQGVLEPLGRATFKVIPARELMKEGKLADDSEFAKHPFGTGPFRYEGRETEGVDRECAVFRANPLYGQRPGRFGLPWVREIRFFVPTQTSLAKDVAGGQLHLYPDAPPETAPRFRQEPGLKDVMSVAVATVNRRVHMLAVNHRQTALQNDKLRQGLSAAINREAILKELFRAGPDDKSHAALTGPFPVKSWATPQSARDTSLYKPGGGGLILEGLGGQRVRLRLTYLTDDPRGAKIAQKIKAQVEEASADKSGKPAVEIDPGGLSAREFSEKVYLEHDYDLALTTFDYRDDLYSLAGLLDPEAAGRGGRNFLGYMAAGTNPVEPDRRLRRKVEEARQYRDFTKQVKELTHDIHHLFNQRVPFIPLWQLDRYMVVHKDLRLYFDNPAAEVKAEQLDPAVVFTGAEMWKLE
ncbi:MAG TPA: ABC transporter substrate-binding protein [Gemmataceae bacterium]|nr:ABC transporter substrate-binding protein [Gemmataceae bacterium]